MHTDGWNVQKKLGLSNFWRVFLSRSQIERLFEDPSEMLPHLTLNSCAKKYSEEDVGSMSFKDHKKIYKASHSSQGGRGTWAPPQLQVAVAYRSTANAENGSRSIAPGCFSIRHLQDSCSSMINFSAAFWVWHEDAELAQSLLKQDYVEALREKLSAADTPERRESMVQLVQELCSLNLAIALAKPSEFAKFHTSRLDDEGPANQQPPPGFWHQCLVCPKLPSPRVKIL